MGPAQWVWQRLEGRVRPRWVLAQSLLAENSGDGSNCRSMMSVAALGLHMRSSSEGDLGQVALADDPPPHTTLVADLLPQRWGALRDRAPAGSR